MSDEFKLSDWRLSDDGKGVVVTPEQLGKILDCVVLSTTLAVTSMNASLKLAQGKTEEATAIIEKVQPTAVQILDTVRALTGQNIGDEL